MSVQAFQRAGGPKELHWIDGASHVDLYDKDEYVTPAIAKLAEFYAASLSSANSSADAERLRSADWTCPRVDIGARGVTRWSPMLPRTPGDLR